jgi:hypothetical protein
MVKCGWRLLFTPSSSFWSFDDDDDDDDDDDGTRRRRRRRRLGSDARDVNRKPNHLCRRDAHRTPGEESA